MPMISSFSSFELGVIFANWSRQFFSTIIQISTDMKIKNKSRRQLLLVSLFSCNHSITVLYLDSREFTVQRIVKLSDNNLARLKVQLQKAQSTVACEQTVLFGWVKRGLRERVSPSLARPHETRFAWLRRPCSQAKSTVKAMNSSLESRASAQVL